MKRKRRRPTPEERAQSEAVLQRLRERIAYHEAKLDEERREQAEKR
jgi:hypothetical protein